MGIDLFAESSRAFELDNPDKVVLVINKDLIKRWEKWCKENDCEGKEIEYFIEMNLDCICA